jgi:uncharacterized protein (TIGR02266 family)
MTTKERPYPGFDMVWLTNRGGGMTTEFDPPDSGLGGGEEQDLIEIDLNFTSLWRFRAEFAPNLGHDGLFIETDEPLPPSTVVRLRILLPEEFVLVEGTAVVEWTREPEGFPGETSGMALRFVTLAEPSQMTIDDIVETHVANGGVAFELEHGTSSAGEIPIDALAIGPPSDSSAWYQRYGKAGSESTGEPFRLTVRTVGPPAGENEVGEEPHPEDVELAPPADDFESIFDSQPVLDEVATEPVTNDFLPPWLKDEAGEPVALSEESAVSDTPPIEEVPSESDEVETSAEDADTLPIPPDDEETVPGEQQAETPEHSAGEFAISMMDEADEPDETPWHPEAGRAADVTVLPEDEKPPGEARGGRRIAVVAAVVVVGIVAAVWLFMGDGVSDEAQPVASVDEAVTVEAEVQEEPAEVTETPERTVGLSADQLAADSQASSPVEAVQATASAVEDVSAVGRGNATVVTVRGNGAFAGEDVRFSSLSDPPRVLIRIRRITSDYTPYRIEVGTSEVQRIRVGHHPEERPPSLFVVLDLADSEIVIREQEVGNDTVRVAVGRR